MLHPIDERLVYRKDPPDQAKEKQEEDDKGYNRPDGNVIDTLKNVLIHSRCI
jgi:hypothetical protein